MCCQELSKIAQSGRTDHSPPYGEFSLIRPWAMSDNVGTFAQHPPSTTSSSIQCDQIWRNFATLAKYNTSLAIFWQFISILAKCEAYFGKFITLLGQFSLMLMDKDWKKSNHLVTLLLSEKDNLNNNTLFNRQYFLTFSLSNSFSLSFTPLSHRLK